MKPDQTYVWSGFLFARAECAIYIFPSTGIRAVFTFESRTEANDTKNWTTIFVPSCEYAQFGCGFSDSESLNIQQCTNREVRSLGIPLDRF